MVPNLNSLVFYYKTTTWSCLSETTCSHDGGSPVIWKFRWVVVEPISNILFSPWLMSNIKLVLETCASISSCSVHEVSVWMKEVTSSGSRAIDASCRREFEKACCCFLWNRPKSVMHTCEVFCGSETCNLHSICVPSTPSHWLICSGKGVVVQILVHAQYFDILDDDFQPELGSVLL